MVCDYAPGERVNVEWQHAKHLQVTQRGFMGNLTDWPYETQQYKRWACIAPHLMSIPQARSAAHVHDEKDRPCVRWTAGSNRDTATYDVACLRYHEELEEFHFWEWNSVRPEARRIPFNRYYRPFTQLRESYTSSEGRRRMIEK